MCPLSGIFQPRFNENNSACVPREEEEEHTKKQTMKPSPTVLAGLSLLVAGVKHVDGMAIYVPGLFTEIPCLKDTTVCEPFSAVFPDYQLNPEAELQVPCDKCVSMEEFASGERVEIGSLDVLGTLYFPKTTKMTLVANGVLIQGHLKIDKSDVVVDGVEDLTFELKGTEPMKWVQHDVNEEACEDMEAGTFDCDWGKRVFAVAGGTVDIKAFPETCPTWLNLADVVRQPPPDITEFPEPVPNPEGCTNVLINSTFHGSLDGWKNSPGTVYSVFNETSPDGFPHITLKDRKRHWQGVQLDISNSFSCLQAGVDYLLYFTVKLSHSLGEKSDCSETGTNCLSLRTHYLNEEGELKWRTLYQMPAAAAVPDEEWARVSQVVRFKEDDLKLLNMYSVLEISGPEAFVDVSLGEFSLELPDAKYYPDPTTSESMCLELIVNQNADLDPRHAYPFIPRTTRDGVLAVEQEQGEDGATNNYFSIKGRKKEWFSIESDFITGCIEQYSIYTFRAKVRVNSAEEVMTRFTLKTRTADDAENVYKVESAGYCPPSSESIGWVECERNFMFTEDHANATEIQLIFVTEEDKESVIDYDDVSVSLAYSPVSTLVLNSTDIDCWGVGSEVMITSHTLKPKDLKVRKVEGTEVVGDQTYVYIDSPIPKHTTMAESPEYAVEVALLSREVLIKPMDDVEPLQPLHGGHFMVLQTPEVAQHIEGVEFRKMGQQGVIGRYPLHIHLCENTNGTVISKNTVRESFQRCYVVHGSHNVTLKENVAYDTFGHCYMVEDGAEQDNKFHYNIGATTKITPDEGVLSIAESDMFASTFWISNPNNEFIGNVCAGGEDTGFWYEFLELVRGPSSYQDPMYSINPSEFDFGGFKDNVMHSYDGDGFKLYPNGYFPETHAAFQDTRSFRNAGDGVLLHNSAKLYIQGGVYADNRVQIEIDKQSDDVWVSDAKVVGYSDLFMLEVEASNTKSHCPARRANVGIQLHSYLRYRNSLGYNLTNIEFSGFGESLTGCINSTAIEMDPQVRDGHFDAYSIFRNLTFQKDSSMGERFSMCTLEEMGKLEDVVLEDLTGDLNPSGDGTPGSIVSRSPKMTTFRDGCTEMEGSCAMYCNSGCYRGVNFGTSRAASYDGWSIKAIDKQSRSVEFLGYFDERKKMINGKKIDDHYDNYMYQRRRFFTATLPVGEYELQFVDPSGNPGWPGFIEMSWEDEVFCGGSIDDSSVTIYEPEIDVMTECSDVIVQNADLEDGTINHWQHTGGDIKIVTPGFDSTYAVSSVNRTGQWQGPGIWLDTRCLVEDQFYIVEAKVKLVDKNSGDTMECDPTMHLYMNDAACPRAAMRVRNIEGNNIGDPVHTTFVHPVATTLEPFNTGGFSNMFGSFTVSKNMSVANSTFLFFERARPGVEIVVDNLKITPSQSSCSDSFFNRDFETGDNRFWTRVTGTTRVDLVSPGYNSKYALRSYNRGQYWASMEHELLKECFVPGQTYQFTLKVRLQLGTTSYDCTPGLNWGVSGEQHLICPAMSIRAPIVNTTEYDKYEFGYVVGDWDKDAWNDMYGTFMMTEDILKRGAIILHFDKVVKEVDLIIDNLKIAPVDALGCDQLVPNGDAQMTGPYYWFSYGQADIGLVTDGNNSTGAIEVANRKTHFDGARNKIDQSCLKEGSIYEVKGMIKMTDELGASMGCDVLKTNKYKPNTFCPTLSLSAQNTGGPPQSRDVAFAVAEWDSSGYNLVHGYFTFFSNEINAESLHLFVHGADSASNFVLDDIELTLYEGATGSGGEATL